MKHLITIGVVACVATSLALASAPMTERLRALQGPEFDRAFLSQMIEHHQQGVEMARLALVQAQSAEVKKFAEKTTTKQKNDIEKMEGLLGSTATGRETGQTVTGSAESAGSSSAGYSSSHMAGSPHEKMKQDAMSRLEAAKAGDFDRAFADEMIKHHTLGIEMARLGQERATRNEIKSLAQKTVQEQSKEIDELSSLKRAAGR